MDKHSKGIWKVAKNAFPWVVAAFPSKAWAKRVYPNLPEEEAGQFIDEVFEIVRVDGNDPITNWEQHVKSLSVHANKLQEKIIRHYIICLKALI